MAARENLTEASFQGERLSEKLKRMSESNPELKNQLKLTENQTKKHLNALRREVVFQKIRALPEFSQFQSEFNTLTNSQRTRVQLALWFRKDLVDGIFWERMFIAMKTLPSDMQKYSLKELSYVDKNGENLELYNNIVKQYKLETPERIKEIQSHFQEIEQDGILWPDTFEAVSTYLKEKKISLTGNPTKELLFPQKEIPLPSKNDTAPAVIQPTDIKEPKVPTIDNGKTEKAPLLPPVPPETPVAKLDTTAEDIRHKAELQRDRQTEAPQLPLPQVQFVNQNPLEVTDSIRKSIEQEQQKNLETSLREVLGLQEGESVKKKWETYILLTKDGKEKQVITDDNSELFMTAQYLNNLQTNGAWDIKSLEKSMKSQKEVMKKIREALGLPANTDIKKTLETYRNSPYGKILAIEEFLSLKKFDDTFIKSFPQYWLEVWDQIIVDDDMGTITIFKKNGKIEVKSTEKFAWIESNLRKYNQFKKDFLTLSKSPQDAQRISQMLGEDVLKMDFEQFFASLVKKDFYNYVQSVKELLDIKSFTGNNYKEFVTKFKNYGISQELLILVWIQTGDLLNFDDEEKTLNIFRGKDNMRKETYTLDSLIELAFSNNDSKSLLELLSTRNNAEKLKDTFKDTIRSNREKARSMLLYPRDLAKNWAQPVNFYENKILERIVTAYDLFGDRPYIKQVNPKNPKEVIIYKNTGNDFFEFRTREEKIQSWDFVSSLWEKMNIRHGSLIIDAVSDEEISRYNEGVSVNDLFEYFSRISSNAKKKEFIIFMNKTIIDSKKFLEAKQIFLRVVWDDTNTFENVFDNQTISKNMTAYSVFGWDTSVNYLSATFPNGKVKIYKRNDALGQFMDESGNKLFLDAKTYSTVVNDSEKFSVVTDFVKPEWIDTNGLKTYLKKLEGSSKEQQIMEYLKKVIKDGKLQKLIREAFASYRYDGSYTIDFKGVKSCEKYLTAFDFFWDQDYLGSLTKSGDVDKEYRKDAETFILLGSPEGEKMKLEQGMSIKVLRKEDIDFTKYRIDSTYRITKLGHARFMRNPRTWVTLCAASAKEFANIKLRLRNTPDSEYAFQQFYKMQQSGESGLTLWEGTITSTKLPERSLWYDEIFKFLEKLRTKGIFAAQIYLDASGDYYDSRGRKAYYGHVATVVLDKDTNTYYVQDAYHNKWTWTELQRYYSDRTSQVSWGTGKNKKFRWVAALV